MVHAPEAFDQMQRVAVWMAHVVEPRLVIEANGVNDEPIPFVFGDGIPEPRYIGILGMLAVSWNFPPYASEFIQDIDVVRGLEDLELPGYI